MSQLRAVFAPGIVFHEFSHWLACTLLGIHVYDVKWFGQQAFVRHARPSPVQSWIVALAPLLVGQVVGFLALSYASLYWPSRALVSLLLFWLGISITLFSFPSTHDVSNAFRSLHEAYASAFSKSLLHKLAAFCSLPLLALPLLFVLAVLWLLDSLWMLRGIWALYVFSLAVHAPAIFL